MKKWLVILAAAVAALTVNARAAELPHELERALPDGTKQILRQIDLEEENALNAGLAAVLEDARGKAGDVLRARLRGAASLLAVVVLCGMVESFVGNMGKTGLVLPMVGALSVTLVTAGSLEDLIGLGTKTIEQLNRFSTVLLPALAAATAASGALTGAAVQKAGTMLLVDLLLKLIHGLLLPMVYLYIGVLTAAAALPENRLLPLADGLKKAVTWVLTTVMLAFTLYLSAVRVVSGAADALSIRLTKAAISGVVPVVGGIIAEASETVLAGALMLRGTLGVGGMVAILAAVAYPFLQLGMQYLVYKLTAFFSAAVGPSGLCKLIDGLGGAFGLVLGMTGACALLLLISVLAFVGTVMP